MSYPIDLVGAESGRLTAISPLAARASDRSVMWLCRCDCGCERIVSSSQFRSGIVTSCGCLNIKRGLCSVERFERNYCPEPNTGCFLWLGRTNQDGYGVQRFGSKSCFAHRVAWILAGRVLPSDEERLLHSCDMPACVNVQHLRTGTPCDNSADMQLRARSYVPPSKIGDTPRWVQMTRGGRYKAVVNYAAVRHYLGTFATVDAQMRART